MTTLTTNLPTYVVKELHRLLHHRLHHPVCHQYSTQKPSLDKNNTGSWSLASSVMLRSLVRARPRAGRHGHGHLVRALLHDHHHQPAAVRLSRFSQPTPPARPSLTRRFSQDSGPGPEDYRQFQVPVLGPAIWAVTAITTIFFTCAAYDVYQDAKTVSKEGRRGLDFEQLQIINTRRQWLRPSSDSNLRDNLLAPISALAAWSNASGPTQAVTGIALVNIAVWAVMKASSTGVREWMRLRFAHLPMAGPFRNSQLITSAFMHLGLVHLGVNMLALFSFGPSLAGTDVFRDSGSHTMAFFLSSAVASAFGNHISTLFWPNKMNRIVYTVGFSGVTAAIFAALALTHSHVRISALLLPGDYSADGFLKGLVVFETLGFLRIWHILMPSAAAHACHLAGLGFGAGYVTYGKNGRFWTASRRLAFRGMKLTRII